jgi:hypothetical protein
MYVPGVKVATWASLEPQDPTAEKHFGLTTLLTKEQYHGRQQTRPALLQSA